MSEADNREGKRSLVLAGGRMKVALQARVR